MKKYLLVTDSCAAEVERKTGLRAVDTPLGALVEKPRPFNLQAELDRLDRAMFPNKPRCICRKSAIIHFANCPLSYMVT
jgi:hypothetical protein